MISHYEDRVSLIVLCQKESSSNRRWQTNCLRLSVVVKVPENVGSRAYEKIYVLVVAGPGHSSNRRKGRLWQNV